MTTITVALVLAGWARAPGFAALGPGIVTLAPAPPPPSFARDITPIVEHWCVTCHGEKEAQDGLRLDSYEAVLKGGDDGPVIVPGDPDGSQLLAQIERRARPAMPPRKHLPRDATAAIRAWIASGAGP